MQDPGDTLTALPCPPSPSLLLCCAMLRCACGGQVLSWMEQCAYISASRLRGAHHLTASMDGVSFAASTRVGDILYIIAQVRAAAGAGLGQPWWVVLG